MERDSETTDYVVHWDSPRLTRPFSDPRIGIGAIVIVHHPAFGPDANAVVVSTPDPNGFAYIVPITGPMRGVDGTGRAHGIDAALLEPCGWVTGYSSAGWPEDV